MSKLNGYALIVGEEGAPHLKILNDLCNSHSLQFIEKNLNLKNKRILDIGCGIGILSTEFAARCLPNGSVTAIDASEDQLKIAKKIAEEANITNIKFLNISAVNNDQVNEKFDLIYCRFVLHHLHYPNDAINKMTSLMHPESILIIEEPEDLESMFCDPPEPIFNTWKNLAFKQLEDYKRNFSLGRDLRTLFSQNNLETMQSSTVQPIIDTPYLKQLLWKSIEEISTLLTQRGFSTTAQITDFIQNLKMFAENSKSKIGYLKYTQIAARKWGVK
ncbi:MAG: methyltransferase domain-containing protein [Pseudomonadota bacterium]